MTANTILFNTAATRRSTTYADIERKAAAQNIPLYAHVELTERCNLDCVHCYLAPGTRRSELTTAEWQQTFDELAEIGTLYLALTGGEILARRDFFDLAEHARSRDFALRLFTNATLITREIARRIAGLRPLLVEISVYGMTAATHDGVTTMPGSFDRTMAAIHALREHRLKLLLKTPVMTTNLSEVPAIREFAAGIGAEFRADAVISPKLDAAKTPLCYRLDEDGLAWFFREFGREWKQHAPNPDVPVCNAGRGVLAISPRGDVFPCLRIQQSAGNVREKSLREIWEQAPLLHEMRELAFAKLQGCSKCDEVGFCNPCPGLALLEHGNLNQPAEECCRQAGMRKAALAG